MGLTVTGVLMILFPVTIRIVALRTVSLSPKATPTHWTWAIRAPMLWAGVVSVIIPINQTAGAVVFGVGMIVWLALGAKLLINAPRATLKAWRTIGDPDAWRDRQPPSKASSYFVLVSWSGTGSHSGCLPCCYSSS